MAGKYGPFDSEFEAKWNSLDEGKQQRTMIIVLIASLILIVSIVSIYSQRHHDAFVDPKIKLQVPQSQAN